MLVFSKLKNEQSHWNITLPSNGSPISYKTDNGAQCNFATIISSENVSPKPDERV